jgi:nucleotide-binding universal stress UspA family protein
MSMKIVVGVDGSEPAKRALDWCATFAARLDAEVVAVHAIDLPVIVAPMTTYVPIQHFTEVNREELREIVTREWCAPLSNASIPFRVVLKEGDPGLVLIETARDEHADLVVTGRRGRGGFTELLLGSTSSALIHHLNGPVMIVP